MIKGIFPSQIQSLPPLQTFLFQWNLWHTMQWGSGVTIYFPRLTHHNLNCISNIHFHIVNSFNLFNNLHSGFSIITVSSDKMHLITDYEKQKWVNKFFCLFLSLFFSLVCCQGQCHLFFHYLLMLLSTLTCLFSTPAVRFAQESLVFHATMIH